MTNSDWETGRRCAFSDSSTFDSRKPGKFPCMPSPFAFARLDSGFR